MMTDEEQEMMDAIAEIASNDSSNNDDFDSFGPNPEEDESAAENGSLDGTFGDDSDTSLSFPGDPWGEQDTVAAKEQKIKDISVKVEELYDKISSLKQALEEIGKPAPQKAHLLVRSADTIDCPVCHISDAIIVINGLTIKTVNR